MLLSAPDGAGAASSRHTPAIAATGNLANWIVMVDPLTVRVNGQCISTRAGRTKPGRLLANESLRISDVMPRHVSGRFAVLACRTMK